MKEAMTGLGRALIILFVLLLIMNVGKLFMPKSDNNSGQEQVVDVGENEEKEKEKKTGNYDNAYKYEELYEKYNYLMVQEYFGEDFKDIYYKGKEFTKEFYLYLSVINLTKNNYIVVCNSSNTLKASDVHAKIKELFGGSVQYSPISYTSKDKSISIEYNEETKEYVVKTKRCAGVNQDKPHVETKFLGGKKVDDTSFEIYENAYYVKISQVEGNLVFEYHKDVFETSTKVYDTSKMDESTFAKYRMIFEINNDNYYLKAIKNA